MEEKLNVDQVI